MDIIASLFGTTPGLTASATPGLPADADAFAAALGQIPSPEPGLVPGAVPTPPATGAALPPVPLATAEPGPLQPVQEEFAPEPWMTARAGPGRPGKLPRPIMANQPAPLAPALPDLVAAAPVAPVVRSEGETPALVPELASLPAPAPELVPEVAGEPAPAPVLVAIAASLPEPVARTAPPPPDAEVSLETPAAADAPAAPKLEPRLSKAEAEPAFTPAATPDRPAPEPVVARAEARMEAPVRVEATAPAAAPGAASGPAPVPVQQAVAPQAPVAPVAPPSPVRASLETGFGERIGLAIARRLGEGGDEMTVRMEPAELGRIQVKLSFDEQGSLRAVLSAETAAVIDALRRDSADLARALGDAGVRTDAQSFRFDRGGAGEQGQSAWARWQAQHGGRDGRPDGGAPADEHLYRPAKRNGRLDLMA